MHTIFALTVLALLMLGLTSVVDRVAKTIQSRRNPSTEAIDYQGWVDAAGHGLTGVEVDMTPAMSGLGRIGSAIVHLFGHLLHYSFISG